MTFTPNAQASLGAAGAVAQRLGHDYVGSEHLLLGLLQQPKSSAARLLRNQGLTRRSVQDQLIADLGTGSPLPLRRLITPRLEKIMELAVGESLRLHCSKVGSRHLLLGMLRQGDGGGVKLLSEAGLHPNRLYRQIAASMSSSSGSYSSRSRGDVDYTPPASSASTRLLDQHTRDMVQLACRGAYDPVTGREEEIRRVIQILIRRSKNNPLLLGDPGVGKTAVAEGLAQKMSLGQVPDQLRRKRLLALDLPSVVAGTKYRGEFEERMKNILGEIHRAGNIILFLDELHTVIGAGSAEGAIDAANIIKPALARGELQLIGATTTEEFRRFIEKDAALERRFQPVRVEEPSEKQALSILKTLSPRYSHHHGLVFAPDAMEAAVSLSVRYLPDRRLPDKAIDLLDEAASQARLQAMDPPEALRHLENRVRKAARERDDAIAGQDYEKAALYRDAETNFRRQLEEEKRRWHAELTDPVVSAKEVASVVSQWTGIPVSDLTRQEKDKLLGLEAELSRRVTGQEEAVAAVARAIRRSRAGLKEPGRPTGSFLFLGPTGVGKTELCKALAQQLFGKEDAMLRFDMTEFSEKHTTSRLTGSPPGYVGHEEGGQLTEAVRRHPYSVLLFDELEKAHPDVWSLLLQIMEDGVLTDAHGKRTDFRNTVIVMTSNVGGERLSTGTPLGFGSGDPKTQGDAVLQRELRQVFRPEFLNRLDEIIVFHPLGEEQMTVIARKLLGEFAQRMSAAGVGFQASEAAIAHLVKKGTDPRYGARPLRRLIRTQVENPAAELLLQEEAAPGSTLYLEELEGALTLVPRG